MDSLVNSLELAYLGVGVMFIINIALVVFNFWSFNRLERARRELKRDIEHAKIIQERLDSATEAVRRMGIGF
jgi:flagellar biogenesis protein FliO